LFAFLLASAQLSAQRQIAEPCHLLTVVADDLVDLHFLPLSGAEAAGLFLFPAVINSLIFLLHCGVVFASHNPGIGTRFAPRDLLSRAGLVSC